MVFKKSAVLGAAAVFAVTAAANAQVELQIDINSVKAQATDGFNGTGTGAWGGLTHTGSITLSWNAPDNLAGVFVDGVNQNVTPMWELTAGFSVVINLEDGVVKGGTIFVEVSDTGPGGSGPPPLVDTYSANIRPNSGTVQGSGGSQTNPPFKIDGLTFDGIFSGTTFAGVDVTPWQIFLPDGAPGSFLNFEFRPNASGFDSSADIDIFVVIPLPSAAGMGALAMIGLAGTMRRRREDV